MSPLTASIQALVDTFADDLLTIVRSASLDELTGAEASAPAPRAAPAPRSARPKAAAKLGQLGRLQRRSAEQIQEALGSVVALIRRHKDGLRSEQIRTELGLDVREVPRLLQQGISDKVLKILGGEKRATRYGAGAGGKAKATPKIKAKPKAKTKKAAPKTKAKKAAKAKKSAPKKTRTKSASKKNSVPETAAAA